MQARYSDSNFYDKILSQPEIHGRSTFRHYPGAHLTRIPKVSIVPTIDACCDSALCLASQPMYKPRVSNNIQSLTPPSFLIRGHMVMSVTKDWNICIASRPYFLVVGGTALHDYVVHRLLVV